MSTLRNTVQRRNHRERAQPLERQKWGILEKPKDYKLRAADHKIKKRKLKALQQKAGERNEDEFYFGMMNSQSQGGVKVAKRGEENSGGAKELTGDAVRLMKTQDVGYLRTMLQQTKRERERLEKDAVQGDVGVKTGVDVHAGKRTVFAEDGKDVYPKQQGKDTEEDFMEDWTSGDSDVEGRDMETENLSPEDQVKRRKQESRRKRLRAAREREQDLTLALQELEDQRAKSSGSMGGVNKMGVKFKVRQRKR